MRVFVAGGTGAIGIPLVRALVAAGHQVTATTRYADRETMLRALGAAPAVVDALDAEALEGVVRAAAPTHVIHQLTALPKAGVRHASELEATNRLRDEGTRNLLHAAIASGARRFIGGSFALIGAAPAAAASDRDIQAATAAVRSMEAQILEAAARGAIEGIVLRYGLFYGPGTGSTDEMIAMVRRRRLPKIRGDRGELPYIHIEDAASATVAALDRGRSGSVYVIVDDRPASFSEMVEVMAKEAGAKRPFTVPAWVPRLLMPYMARLLAIRLPLSNAAARADLGWHPRYASYREGLRATLQRAA